MCWAAVAATQAQDALALSEESDDLQAQRLASGVMAKLEILEGRPGQRHAALRGRSQRG
jgi:hypothetical protein